MPRALSLDLRVRVLTAVARGLSHRQAGEQFGVSAASVSRWRALERERGEARARSQGGDRRSGRVEAHKDTILALVEETPDIAIEELRQALADKGVAPPGVDLAHQRVRSASVILSPDRLFTDAAREALTVREGVAPATV